MKNQWCTYYHCDHVPDHLKRCNLKKSLFLVVTAYFMFHLIVWILFRWFVNTLKSQYCSTVKRWEWWSLTSATCSCYGLHSPCVSTPTTSSGCALLTGIHKSILYVVSDILHQISKDIICQDVWITDPDGPRVIPKDLWQYITGK